MAFCHGRVTNFEANLIWQRLVQVVSDGVAYATATTAAAATVRRMRCFFYYQEYYCRPSRSRPSEGAVSPDHIFPVHKQNLLSGKFSKIKFHIFKNISPEFTIYCMDAECG